MVKNQPSGRQQRLLSLVEFMLIVLKKVTSCAVFKHAIPERVVKSVLIGL
jgi:hypothetical protein